MTEMATMGIGNKPCLDIKPSANNIQDRFINYAIGNRGGKHIQKGGLGMINLILYCDHI